MVWIAALALCATAYLLVDTCPTSVVALVAGTVVPVAAVALPAVVWFSSPVGPWSSAVSSLRFLTGLPGFGQIVPSGCTSWGQGSTRVVQTIVVVLLLAVALVAVVPALGGIIGVPIGVVTSVGGGVVSAVRRDAELLRFGLGVLTGGLTGVVLGALLLRGLHAGYAAVMC